MVLVHPRSGLQQLGDVLGCDGTTTGQQCGPFAAALQFPHVAWPLVRVQRVQCCGRQLVGGTGGAGKSLAGEIGGEQAEVAAALAQGLQDDGQNGQAIEELGAEGARSGLAFEVGAGSCHQADARRVAHTDRGGARDAHEELLLDLEGQVLHAIEEEGSPMSLRKDAGLSPDGDIGPTAEIGL